ncbi:hypothetical protein NX868_10430 [Burkholderia thailandensis]|uniref:hypothetical protein n=1 Tax=Burkholderia thailandensis TaxID=57975 RepID=UPI000EF34D48|nr:hypothetical protein [Burkholderia thailandensis]AYJ74310.1 hypothetical protein phiE131_044 [Burkholderia phage phiE131]AYJ74380.1 hypothetical protein phiE058_044 [Burkholderia phage phiE058]MCS6455978.1 hypothetical protein [Burkholderia thailandensis]MCS6482693.1 hypothetical protein [Burkholderia thailandensis]NOK41612.1 hypothetical protein [Burkholderia thailandensis]
MSDVITTNQDTAPGAFDLSPRSLEQAMQLANILADSSIVPKDFIGKPGNVLVAIQWGMELGLKPMQAMQNIAVINGRPSLWGDALLALVLASPVCEYVQEWEENGTAFIKVKRRGKPEDVQSFSDDDAKKAGLIGKQGPWAQYPQRMKKMRARAFALRDNFADVLKGIAVAEEVMDIEPVERDITPRATPAQIASNAAQASRPPRTDRHDKIVKDLEGTAINIGFEAFKAKWEALEHADRAAIGRNERDRIAALAGAPKAQKQTDGAPQDDGAGQREPGGDDE